MGLGREVANVTCRSIFDCLSAWQLRRRLQSRTGAGGAGASSFAIKRLAIVVDVDVLVRYN